MNATQGHVQQVTNKTLKRGLLKVGIIVRQSLAAVLCLNSCRLHYNGNVTSFYGRKKSIKTFIETTQTKTVSSCNKINVFMVHQYVLNTIFIKAKYTVFHFFAGRMSCLPVSVSQNNKCWPLGGRKQGISNYFNLISSYY